LIDGILFHNRTFSPAAALDLIGKRFASDVMGSREE
jgi:hypothetical protein